MALVETVRASGLDRGLSQTLSRWRKPLARHDPGKIVTDLALALAVGGDCLADVAVLRAEPSVFGAVASIRRCRGWSTSAAADADRVLAGIDAVRATARARVWAAAGQHAPDHCASAETPVVIDIDATLVTAHSDKEQAAPTFKKGFGFHPLLVFADHGAVLKAAFAQLPGHRARATPIELAAACS